MENSKFIKKEIKKLQYNETGKTRTRVIEEKLNLFERFGGMLNSEATLYVTAIDCFNSEDIEVVTSDGGEPTETDSIDPIMPVTKFLPDLKLPKHEDYIVTIPFINVEEGMISFMKTPTEMVEPYLSKPDTDADINELINRVDRNGSYSEKPSDNTDMEQAIDYIKTLT